jgi:TrmH family RNA methyltransferase
MISSLTNSQIKNIIKLQKQAKVRNEQGLFVVEGKKMFEEARDQENVSLEKSFVSESYYVQQCDQDESYFKGSSFEIVSDAVMKEASETMTPQGILALVKKPKYQLSDMLNKERVRLLILEDVRDPGNLGTMIRTAEGVGISGVIMSKDSVDIFNPKVIRSTMGAIYRVPFIYCDNFIETLSLIKDGGISIYAAHLAGAVRYDAVDYGQKSAIMIGNEANGLSSVASDLATRCIKIPMEGCVESLNAAIAAAVLMYEVYKKDYV